MTEKLEIYKLAVEMADRVSARRMAANGYFLTVNTALVGILGFSYEKVSTDHRALLLITASVGLLLAATWFFAIRSYKRLNKAKYDVINAMEADLPEQYFTKEWSHLQADTAKDGEPKPLRARWIQFKDRYTDLTNIEAVVPIAFIIVYVVIFLGAAFKVIA
jgi:hypothetical protein